MNEQESKHCACQCHHDEEVTRLVAFVSGTPEEKVKQKTTIESFCAENAKHLNMVCWSNLFEVLRNVGRDDTVIITSLTVLSEEPEELADILYVLFFRHVNIFPIEQSNFLHLWDWSYMGLRLRDGGRALAELRDLAAKVLRLPK